MLMMKAFNKDENMKGLIDSAEIFIDGATELETLFMGNYDGGDFCSGLIFGRSGSKMLLEMVSRFMQIPDDHNPELKEKHPKGRVTDDFI